MRRHLEKLKEQPEEHRQTLALSFALLFTALVAMVWLSTLGTRFAAIEVEDVTASAGQAKEALSQLKVKAGIGDMPAKFEEVRKVLEKLQSGAGNTQGSPPKNSTRGDSDQTFAP